MKKYLEQCKAAYYEGNPIISDSQYDALEEMCSEDLTVGTNKGRSKHLYRMYSLQKYYKGDDLPVLSTYSGVTPKLDGAAIALTYWDGWLQSIVTRGNGEYGEDVTHLFNAEKCVKMGIAYSTARNDGVFQVNGEVVAKKYIPNARNYAAGALNLKSAEEFDSRELMFFAYSMQETPFESYQGTLSYLKELGFNTVRDRLVDQYPQDGVVYRLEGNKDYENLGYTNKHPRGAFALKERSEGVETTINDVIWQVGKSGKVTPVAILEPVNIDGATIKKATLNNPGFIEALGVQIGDSVMVERAGGIIPRIICKVPS